MSIFLAGHNGLVGSAIVRRLKEDGYTRYGETNLQAQADMLSTCQRFPHSGRVIR